MASGPPPRRARPSADRPPFPGFSPARLEVVRGTVVATSRHVTGGTVSSTTGHAAIRSTPELWVALPGGGERRLLGEPLADARPGHEVAVVLDEDGRFERVLCLVNLSTRATLLGEPVDPERAAVRGIGDLLAYAFLWSLALALPVILATMWVVLGLIDALLPRAAADAAVGLAFQLGLLLVPVAGVWLTRHRARRDLARREARLRGVEAALAAAGVDMRLARQHHHGQRAMASAAHDEGRDAVAAADDGRAPGRSAFAPAAGGPRP